MLQLLHWHPSTFNVITWICRRSHLGHWVLSLVSWLWGPVASPGLPWEACWGRDSVRRQLCRYRRHHKREQVWRRPAPARALSAGFGPWCRWAGTGGWVRPELSWFLRYILQRTVGSFAAWSHEPLEECGGLWILGGLLGENGENDVKTKWMCCIWITLLAFKGKDDFVEAKRRQELHNQPYTQASWEEKFDLL